MPVWASFADLRRKARRSAKFFQHPVSFINHFF